MNGKRGGYSGGLPASQVGLPQKIPSATMRRHHCDLACICPIHATPLIYWPFGDDHACQDVNCEYGHDGLRRRTLAGWV